MISSTCRIVLRSCNVRNATPFFATSKSTILKRQQNAMNAICARFLNDDVEPIDAVKAAVKKHRTKTPEPPKVTLLDSKNNVIAVTTKDDAEKMALHKNLKLVHIVDKDLRSTRPVYRLMSDAQYLEEELARKRQLKEEKKANKESFLKGEKTILLSANITQNDLQVKLKKTLKWSEKRFEVRVVISGSAENTAPQEAIYNEFEKIIQGKARIVQKRSKNGELKFQILPPKPEVSKDQPDSKQPSSKNKADTSPGVTNIESDSQQPNSEDANEVISSSSKM